MESLVRNASDKEQVRHADKRLETRRLQELEDIRKVLETPSGRRFYWRILSMCGITKQTYIDGNPNGTFFLEGKRSIGNELFSDAQSADLKAVFEMMQDELLKGFKNA